MKISFEPTRFKEMEQYFRARVPLTPEEFKELERDAKLLAFTVSQVTAMDAIKSAQDEIDKAITSGKTVAEFRESFMDFLERKGLEGISPYRIDTIFRTNVQTAYHVGRYKQMTDPDVIDERPWWMYSAVHDSHTRPEHLALDGQVHRSDDPFWNMWYPPNGYNCRCDVITLDQEAVEDLVNRGVAKVSDVMPLNTPDPGFTTNPGQVAWEPDLSKYPAELVQAYRERMAEFQNSN